MVLFSTYCEILIEKFLYFDMTTLQKYKKFQTLSFLEDASGFL
jgi:hypothetical protein